MPQQNIVKEITVHELKNMIDQKTDFQLIDVREPDEYEITNINGELMPLGSIMENENKIARDKTVVIHCRSGGRSTHAIEHLNQKYGFDNLYNLKGGILAWAEEIDNSISHLLIS